jgi:hypothetical protein
MLTSMRRMLEIVTRFKGRLILSQVLLFVLALSTGGMEAGTVDFAST